MDLVPFIINKGGNTQDNGIKIKCKEEVPFTTQMVNLLMRANGIKINYMDMEFFIINVQLILLRQ